MSAGSALSRLEKLLTGGGKAHGGDVLFVKEVLEDPYLPQSRVDGLFLTYKGAGEGLLRRVREAYPEDLNASILLTRVYAADGRYREAEDEFKELISRHPGDAWLFACYASFLRELGRRGEADACFRRALSLDPQEPNYRIEYAMFLEETGRAGRAKRFIKQALKLLPPGDELKDWLMVWQRGVLGRMLWSLLSDPPSAGSMGRLVRHHGEELIKELKEEPGITPRPAPESGYLTRARMTGMYGKAILEVEDAKPRRAVEDPDEWAHVEEIDILNTWKPGFGLYVNRLFFDSKCPGCGLEGRKLRGCMEGLHNCSFEEEYDQFEMDAVREVVKRLKEGVEPEGITLLRVPESLKETAQRLQAERARNP